jgi:3,4-dihydroxy 2-butanone 4-phosphate synthase/GTP cyclohydrolase II
MARKSEPFPDHGIFRSGLKGQTFLSKVQNQIASRFPDEALWSGTSLGSIVQHFPRIESVVKNFVKTRIPTIYGEFTLYLYLQQGKEHLALVKNDVRGQPNVPVRVHSECITGDVFGSRRCDCGDQLKHTLQYLGRSRCGILIYLRQEGRGIGLRKKLEAYNLQDHGLDTVEANLQLGHQADERDYSIAALILKDLGVQSIRLVTNNPRKVDELREHGIEVEERIPIEVGQHRDNLGYLRSKAEKLAHLLTFRERVPAHDDLAFIEPLLDQLSLARTAGPDGIFVTWAYIQSMNGNIISDVPAFEQAMALSHYLKSKHDAFLVDIETTAGYFPSINGNESPIPIIWDRYLRISLDNVFLKQSSIFPIILTTNESATAQLQTLTALGAKILVLKATDDHYIDLHDVLKKLKQWGIHTLLIEGRPSIISTFLETQLVNYCVITITPKIIGGSSVIDPHCHTNKKSPLTLMDCQYHILGSEVIAYGSVNYS